jgi:hypothetical protein
LFGPYSVYDCFCPLFKALWETSGAIWDGPLKRFNKYPFQIVGKTATILRKEHLSQDPIEMATACKHPRVRIVSRHEDTEFVECLECGEVFDSEEFRDMEIEESVEKEDVAGEV